MERTALISGNQITLPTFPPLFSDMRRGIYNPNYDNEMAIFTVPYDWFKRFLADFGYTDEEEWLDHYTWDDTCYMLGKAYFEGHLLRNRTILKNNMWRGE